MEKVQARNALTIFLIVAFVLLAIAALALSALDNIENGGDDGFSGACFVLALGFACIALSLKREREYNRRFPDGELTPQAYSERSAGWVCSIIIFATGLFGLLLWVLHH